MHQPDIVIKARKSVLRFYASIAAGLCLAILLSTSTGCGGCRQDADENKTAEEKKKEEEEEKKLPDFESIAPMAMPSLMNDPIKVKRANSKLKDDPVQRELARMMDRSRQRHKVKLGHWHDVRFQAIANNFDFQGELNTFALAGGSEALVPGTDFTVSFRRPIALSKGEWKTFESTLFIPRRSSKIRSQQFQCEINRRGGRLSPMANANLPLRMQGFQYQIVLLTSNPDSYRFIDLAPSIRIPASDPIGDPLPEHYTVIASPAGMPNPLPRYPLSWTTIAYVIWDDLDPDELDPDQQQGMLDWLHFGGQLIVSGPDCLERLESSFLADYLPALSDQARTLTPSDVTDLNENWSLPEKNAVDKRRELKISDKLSILAVSLVPHETATEVEGTGGLVFERMLGRGRIVATAFSLKAPAVRSWRSFDSFFNGALLRRPGRRFAKSNDLYESVDVQWLGNRASYNDPMVNSTLRYLSRDIGDKATAQITTSPVVESEEGAAAVDPFVGKQREYNRNLEDNWHYGGFESDPVSGVAGWNDFEGVASVARATLLDAAGIAPPSSSLVLKMLAGYLIVLVPLNWLIFRLIGKVEFAWIAVPLISIVGAFVVIRMAALDIGFSRSNIQVGLLELHADFDRGHLTEYAALYTSLSTRYRVEMRHPSAQALPFPNSQFEDKSKPERSLPLTFERTSRSELDGVLIQSNSTRLLHLEQMVDMGGPVKLDRGPDDQLTITNGMAMGLEHVIIAGTVMQNGSPVRVFADVGDLAADSQQQVTLSADSAIYERYKGQAIFGNTERRANQMWSEQFGEEPQVNLEQLRDIPEVEENWEDYLTQFAQQEAVIQNRISRVSFLETYQELNPTPRVTLGRLLDQIDRCLASPVGELRLYAATREQVGGSNILPEATQTDRQTLVVVHLTQPQMLPPRPDTNSIEDLNITSDIDAEREMQLFDNQVNPSEKIDGE